MTRESYKKAGESGPGKFFAMFSADIWVEYAKKHYAILSMDEILKEHPENTAYKFDQLQGIQIKRGKVTGSVKGRDSVEAARHMPMGRVIRTVSRVIKLEIAASCFDKVLTAMKTSGIAAQISE